MSEYIKLGLKIIYAIIILYWSVSAISAKQVKSQEPFFKRFLFYWFPIIVALALLGPGKWYGDSMLRENFVEHTDTVGLIGLTLAALGAAVALWSRVLLGKNWSIAVQQKEDHELIKRGPYRVVRHPIYSGLLLLFTGHALIVGDYRAILAVIIVFVSFWFKLKKEEDVLTKVFGDRYTQYKKETKAIVPFIL